MLQRRVSRDVIKKKKTKQNCNTSNSFEKENLFSVALAKKYMIVWQDEGCFAFIFKFSDQGLSPCLLQ